MFDMHVHSAPCRLPRRWTDSELVDICEREGLTGIVLKSHFESTAGRANAAGHGRSLTVVGGVVLNHPVGGINPDAVESALALGARVVWMPTLDSLAHQRAGLTSPAPTTRPLALRLAPSLPRAIRTILDHVTQADAVLATGHLSGREAAWLVRRARAHGVRRVVVTHASYVVPGLTAREARELADLGAWIEVCAYQLLHQPGSDGRRLASFVRTVGPRRCVMSSDTGQPNSPSPAEALSLLSDALKAHGVGAGAVDAMMGEQPATLVLA